MTSVSRIPTVCCSSRLTYRHWQPFEASSSECLMHRLLRSQYIEVEVRSFPPHDGSAIRVSSWSVEAGFTISEAFDLTEFVAIRPRPVCWNRSTTLRFRRLQIALPRSTLSSHVDVVTSPKTSPNLALHCTRSRRLSQFWTPTALKLICEWPRKDKPFVRCTLTTGALFLATQRTPVSSSDRWNRLRDSL